MKESVFDYLGSPELERICDKKYPPYTMGLKDRFIIWTLQTTVAICSAALRTLQLKPVSGGPLRWQVNACLVAQALNCSPIQPLVQAQPLGEPPRAPTYTIAELSKMPEPSLSHPPLIIPKETRTAQAPTF